MSRVGASGKVCGCQCMKGKLDKISVKVGKVVGGAQASSVIYMYRVGYIGRYSVCLSVYEEKAGQDIRQSKVEEP